MYYPVKNKPKLASGSAIPVTTATQGSGNNAIGNNSNEGGIGPGMFSMAAQIGSTAIDQFVPDRNQRYGLSYKPVGAQVGKGALSGAAKGAAIGSIIPGVGTAVGAVVGGALGAVSGLIKGKKEKKAVEKQVDQLDQQSAVITDRQSQLAYNSLPTQGFTAYARKGGMIPGGFGYRIQSAEKGAVILGGQPHKSEGNFGKGNPGLDQNGQKVVEVEAKEMLFTLEQSEKIHNLIEQYWQNPSEDILFDLGSLARSIINNVKTQK